MDMLMQFIPDTDKIAPAFFGFGVLLRNVRELPLTRGGHDVPRASGLRTVVHSQRRNAVAEGTILRIVVIAVNKSRGAGHIDIETLVETVAEFKSYNFV